MTSVTANEDTQPLIPVQVINRHSKTSRIRKLEEELALINKNLPAIERSSPSKRYQIENISKKKLEEYESLTGRPYNLKSPQLHQSWIRKAIDYFFRGILKSYYSS